MYYTNIEELVIVKIFQLTSVSKIYTKTIGQLAFVFNQIIVNSAASLLSAHRKLELVVLLLNKVQLQLIVFCLDVN